MPSSSVRTTWRRACAARRGDGRGDAAHPRHLPQAQGCGGAALLLRRGGPAPHRGGLAVRRDRQRVEDDAQRHCPGATAPWRSAEVGTGQVLRVAVALRETKPRLAERDGYPARRRRYFAEK